MSYLPTPYIAHLTADDYEHVYEPAEDSFALLDALEIDAEQIRSLQPTICLEIGVGSGIASTFLAKICGATSVFSLGTDINPFACAATTSTATRNSVIIDAVRCDLVSALATRCQRMIDICVFNPPYVETDDAEAKAAQDAGHIAGAWAGGDRGMRITERVIADLPMLLSPQGRFYLVAIEQNRPQDIMSLAQSLHLHVDVVLERRAGRERYTILRISRAPIS